MRPKKENIENWKKEILSKIEERLDAFIDHPSIYWVDVLVWTRKILEEGEIRKIPLGMKNGKIEFDFEV